LLTKLAEQARDGGELRRALFEDAANVIAILSKDGTILEQNASWARVMGLPRERMIGRHIGDFAADGHEHTNLDGYRDTFGDASTTVAALKAGDGRTLYMQFSNTVVQLGGESVVFSLGHDITERVFATRSAKVAEAKYRLLIEHIPDVVCTVGENQTLTFVTPNVARVTGYSQAEMYEGGIPLWRSRVHLDDLARVLSAQTLEPSVSGELYNQEYRWKRKDGTWIWLHVRTIAIYQLDGRTYTDRMISDVTKRRELEESLRQAQKMEALGQLTGGIAHDFNNMLAAILGYSYFLLETLGSSDPRRRDAEEIHSAAERGAGLTRQLLAFSRRQVLDPRVVRLDTVVQGIEPMLRRLLDEDIDLTVHSMADLGTVRVDVGQIEQVLLNLVVNARDAMPRGGKLSIDTYNVDVDAGGSHDSAEVPPGRYVMLSVMDTGCGMDEATRRRIYEPFFTTKEQGKGTGLGLATCYGIVKQSGGHIVCHSDPGAGAVFEIYLPRLDLVVGETQRRARSPVADGSETILLVEDDAGLRAIIARMLEARGYAVLVARDVHDAVALGNDPARPIHLVLSDVVMPGRSGPEVVDAIRQHRPEARALFMSGHTDHATLREGVLSSDLSFIQKPFSPIALATTVREVLDA
jgi:PAS domain S-box-containing protein